MNKAVQTILITVIVIFAGLIGLRYFVKNNADKAKIKVKTELTEIPEKEFADEIVENRGKEINNEEKNIVNSNDINKASFFDLKKAGIKKKQAESIIETRNRVGAFFSIKDIAGIKGVGDKSVQTLSNTFSVDIEFAKTIMKKININLINDDETYEVLGLNKKEIEKIKKWKTEKGKIFSNVEMMQICDSPSNFDYISPRIYYTDY